MNKIKYLSLAITLAGIIGLGFMFLGNNEVEANPPGPTETVDPTCTTSPPAPPINSRAKEEIDFTKLEEDTLAELGTGFTLNCTDLGECYDNCVDAYYDTLYEAIADYMSGADLAWSNLVDGVGSIDEKLEDQAITCNMYAAYWHQLMNAYDAALDTLAEDFASTMEKASDDFCICLNSCPECECYLPN